MNDPVNKKKASYAENIKRNALVSASVGCLTIVIAGLALIVGLIIDSRLGTAPKWTLILLLGSTPISLLGVYLVVRRALKKNREEGQRIAMDAPEEDKRFE